MYICIMYMPYVCMYIYIYIYVYVCMCVYIYIYREREIYAEEHATRSTQVQGEQFVARYLSNK